jgi:hypothetical protein
MGRPAWPDRRTLNQTLDWFSWSGSAGSWALRDHRTLVSAFTALLGAVEAGVVLVLGKCSSACAEPPGWAVARGASKV